MTIKIAVRADANHHIGGGHVMRCARLLSAFDDQNVEMILITDQRTVSDFPALTEAFDKVELLDDAFDLSSFETALKNQTPLDVIIFDHYEISAEYEGMAKSHAGSLMALDDLERFHDVDVLFHFNQSLDQNALGACARQDSIILRDPCYFPLDKAFEKAKKWSLQSVPKNVFMCFGYDDPKLFSAKILDSLCGYDCELSVTLIMGEGNRAKVSDVIERFQCYHDIKILHGLNANSLVNMMADSDFAIGAAGGNIYERAVLGHPSIVFEYVDNQRPNISYFENKNAIINAGKIEDFSPGEFLSVFTDVFKNHDRQKVLSDNSLKIMGAKLRLYLDGFLKSYICGDVCLRQATMDDTDFIYSLQDTETRKYYKTAAAPSFDDHKNYMARRVLKPMSFFIISYDGSDAGFIRFDDHDGEQVVSMAVSQNFRGKGIAKNALAQGLCLFPSQKIIAEIHEVNKASIKVFAKAEFEEYDRDGQFIKFSKVN